MAAEKTALLVIDVQNDFLPPNGSLAVKGGLEIIPGINNCMDKVDLVVTSQDWHPQDHVSFVTTHPGKNVGDVVKLEVT